MSQKPEHKPQWIVLAYRGQELGSYGPFYSQAAAKQWLDRQQIIMAEFDFAVVEVFEAKT